MKILVKLIFRLDFKEESKEELKLEAESFVNSQTTVHENSVDSDKESILEFFNPYINSEEKEINIAYSKLGSIRKKISKS